MIAGSSVGSLLRIMILELISAYRFAWGLGQGNRVGTAASYVCVGRISCREQDNRVLHILNDLGGWKCDRIGVGHSG